MDVLAYLKNYASGEVVKNLANTNCTRIHDSLKISNEKSGLFLRGISKYNALDYLLKVNELSFSEAVEKI